MLVGLDGPDDAGVYQLNDEQAIVSTVDFFPPVVDDPYTFGSIAAANAMSDVYAMGGEVLFALNLAAFPDNLDRSILTEILRGGAEKVAEAGAIVIGGHTISDDEPKFGMVALGDVRPDKVITNAGARPGDRLVLTKPLGTGVLSTALKRDLLAERDMAAAVRALSTRNAGAARPAD